MYTMLFTIEYVELVKRFVFIAQNCNGKGCCIYHLRGVFRDNSARGIPIWTLLTIFGQ